MNKLLKKYKIIIAIGLAILLCGVIMIISGVLIKEPEMTADDWFSKSTKKSFLITFGIFVVSSSIFITIIGFALYRNALNYKDENNDGIIDEKDVSIADAKKRGEAAGIMRAEAEKTYAKVNSKFCTHCGCENDLVDKFCRACGAPLK